MEDKDDKTVVNEPLYRGIVTVSVSLVAWEAFCFFTSKIPNYIGQAYLSDGDLSRYGALFVVLITAALLIILNGVKTAVAEKADDSMKRIKYGLGRAYAAAAAVLVLSLYITYLLGWQWLFMFMPGIPLLIAAVKVCLSVRSCYKAYLNLFERVEKDNKL